MRDLIKSTLPLQHALRSCVITRLFLESKDAPRALRLSNIIIGPTDLSKPITSAAEGGSILYHQLVTIDLITSLNDTPGLTL